MPDVRWSRPAERAAFRLSHGPRQRLLRTIDLIRTYPEIGRKVEEGRFQGARQIPIAPYRVLYYRLESNDGCILLAIRDARRRPV